MSALFIILVGLTVTLFSKKCLFPLGSVQTCSFEQGTIYLLISISEWQSRFRFDKKRYLQCESKKIADFSSQLKLGKKSLVNKAKNVIEVTSWSSTYIFYVWINQARESEISGTKFIPFLLHQVIHDPLLQIYRRFGLTKDLWLTHFGIELCFKALGYFDERKKNEILWI